MAPGGIGRRALRASRPTGVQRLSLTLRLILMAVIAALPAVGVQFWNEYDLRRARTQELEEQVLRLASLQSAEIDRLAEGARQFLVALAQLPQIISKDASACAGLLAQI